jgi:hypothetical protein
MGMRRGDTGGRLKGEKRATILAMVLLTTTRVCTCSLAVSVLFSVCSVSGQEPEHGRKYRPPPPTAHMVVTVEKGFNAKPLPNAAVVFHAVRDGHDDGNLEIKTDPDGRATIDVLEVGSHVTVQVIASGFATYSTEFDLTTDSKDLLVKLQRPRAQVSVYSDNDGKASQTQPGTQEHVVRPAPPASPTPPLTTTPVANTPTANAPSGSTPAAATSPH